MTRHQILALTDDALILKLTEAAALIVRLDKQKGLQPQTRRSLLEAKADVASLKTEITRRSYRKTLAASGEQLLTERKSPWCWGDQAPKLSGKV